MANDDWTYGGSFMDPYGNEASLAFDDEEDFRFARDSLSQSEDTYSGFGDELDRFAQPQGMAEPQEQSALTMPVRAPDSFISSVPTSRQALIQSAQDNLLEASKGRLDKLEEARDLISSGGNVWGSLLTAAVPALVGYAVGGKEGLAAMGSAGFEGALEGQKIGMQQARSEADLALREADAYRAQENSYRQQVVQNQTAQVSQQERMDIERMREAGRDRRYGAGGRGVSAYDSPVRPEVLGAAEEARRTGVVDVTSIPGGVTPREYQVIQGAARSYQGHQSKQPTEKTAKELGIAKTTFQRMADIRQTLTGEEGGGVDFQKMSSALKDYKDSTVGRSRGGLMESLFGSKTDAAIENAAFNRAMQELNPNSKEGIVFQKLRELGRSVARASEVGVLTEQDVQFYYEMFTPKALESTETFMIRFDDTLRHFQNKIGNELDMLEGAGRNVEGLRGQFEGTLGQGGATPTAGAIPSIGQTYDGKKVINVRKIK